MGLCLICGVVICQSDCRGHNASSGNWNIHANLFHMGSTAFYHLFDPAIAIIHAPQNVISITKSLYSDAFGQSINEALQGEEKALLKLDFKKFVLNSKFIEELQHMITHHELEKAYFKTMLNLNEEQEIPEDGSL